MPSHSESRVLPYTADLMYAIVADVERYPEFVPWCTDLRILERGRENDYEILIAETVIGYRSMRERYTSRIILDPDLWKVDVTQIKGVFRTLDNHWRFTPEGEESRADFSIVFEFSNPLLGMVANAALGRVMTRMTAAFENRARKLSQQALQ